MHEAANKMSNRLNKSAYQLGILIKAFGKADKAEQATTAVREVLESSDTNLDTEVFISLLNAWAESSRPDSVDQAFSIFRIMDEHPKCRELGIRPTTGAFCALLGCLANSNRKDAGQRAEMILNDFEQRHKAGDDSLRPNERAFTLAIEACLQAEDHERVNALLTRMEKSDIIISRKTYISILKYWSAFGSSAAAEYAERILLHMKHLAAAKGPLLTPDVYAYTLTLDAWTKSGDPSSYERIWKIYKQMIEENVEPNLVTFNSLIRHFSLSNDRQLVQRADSVLTSMENSKRPKIQPDQGHYYPVIKGYLSLGDADSATRVFVRSIQTYIKTKNPEAKPNSIIIDVVMQGWIKHDDLARGTALLDKMQELHEAKLLPDGPDERAYQTLLWAWKRSKLPEKRENIAKLEKRVAAFKRVGES